MSTPAQLSLPSIGRIDADFRDHLAKRPECAVEDCTRSVHCRGWCYMHYSRWWRNGTTDLKWGRPLDRIVLRSDIDPDGCWTVITGKIDKGGYGVIDIEGRKRGIHRVAYELLVGPIPNGLQLDHLCRNRACWRPEHLEPVTQLENIRRGMWAQRTHCKNGHEFNEQNTRLVGGTRYCRPCEVVNQRAYRERRQSRVAS